MQGCKNCKVCKSCKTASMQECKDCKDCSGCMICKTARLQVARIARVARGPRVQGNKNSRITIVTRISQELLEHHKSCNSCKVINHFPDGDNAVEQCDKSRLNSYFDIQCGFIRKTVFARIVKNCQI